MTRYTILKSLAVPGRRGNRDGELVLCHVPESAHPFATWWRDPEDDSYHWGHYLATLDEAMADFAERTKAPKPTLYNHVVGLVADWHASGERNLDRWREKLHEVVDEALSDFQVDHVDVVTDEEEEGNADG